MDNRRTLFTKLDVILYGAKEADENSVGTEVKGLFVPVTMFNHTNFNETLDIILSITCTPPSGYTIREIYPSWSPSSGVTPNGWYAAVEHSQNTSFSISTGDYNGTTFNRRAARTVNFGSCVPTSGYTANYSITNNPDLENVFYMYVKLDSSMPFSAGGCKALMSGPYGSLYIYIYATNIKYTIATPLQSSIEGYPIYYIPA